MSAERGPELGVDDVDRRGGLARSDVGLVLEELEVDRIADAVEGVEVSGRGVESVEPPGGELRHPDHALGVELDLGRVEPSIGRIEERPGSLGLRARHVPDDAVVAEVGEPERPVGSDGHVGVRVGQGRPVVRRPERLEVDVEERRAGDRDPVRPVGGLVEGGRDRAGEGPLGDLVRRRVELGDGAASRRNLALAALEYPDVRPVEHEIHRVGPEVVRRPQLPVSDRRAPQHADPVGGGLEEPDAAVGRDLDPDAVDVGRGLGGEAHAGGHRRRRTGGRGRSRGRGRRLRRVLREHPQSAAEPHRRGGEKNTLHDVGG